MRREYVSSALSSKGEDEAQLTAQRVNAIVANVQVLQVNEMVERGHSSEADIARDR